MEIYRARQHFAYEEDACFIRVDHIDRVYGEHAHDYVELVVILSGTGLHIVDGVSFRLSPGDVFVVQGNSRHSYSEPEDLRLCNVMLMDPYKLLPEDRLRRLPGYQALFFVEPAQRGYRSHMRLDSVQLREVREIIEQMQAESMQRQSGFESMIQAQLLRLVVYLCRAYEGDNNLDRARHLRLAKVMTFIHNHFADELDIDVLARHATMSRRHFLRTFKKTFSITPMDYIIRLRLEHASKVLREHRDLSIAEVAEEAGFNDRNYFSKRFSRAYGITPQRFRNSIDRI